MDSKISRGGPTYSFFPSIFLLFIRLWWGFLFFMAGLFKLSAMPDTIMFFNSMGLSTFVAYIVSIGELVCGVLIFFGFITRLAALGTTVIMFGAYIVAHRLEFLSFFSNPPFFFSAPAFSFLFASLVILFFGGGMFSIDAAIYSHMRRKALRSQSFEERHHKEDHQDENKDDPKD